MKPNKQLEFIRHFVEISPYNLHDILEYLIDNGYLNDGGKKFSYEFWEMFIKRKK